ncbi:hypothetical protein [Terrabacter sp. NPDC080008]|uniref:hypothetical protein n=1 Tax=Terrabacter sp. NPDC080008 TaxID=3155176 RepID=UPI00344CB07D
MGDFESSGAHPLSRILAIKLAYDAGIVTFVRDDLMVATAPLSRPQGVGATVASSTLFPQQSRMEFVASDHTLSVKLSTGQDRCELPTVYLDQRDWIDFARWAKDPQTVTPAKREFFELLASSANEERVVIPLSGAHLKETSKRGGASRVQLAATMLRYSRGWQMRSVLALRRAELRALFGGAPLTISDVVTLAPRAVFDMERPEPAAPDLDPEISDLIERQVWATVLTDLLIDPDPMPDEGKEVVEKWSQSFLPLATAIPGNGKAKARIRDLTRTRFISDLGTDLPGAAKEAGLSSEEFGTWLSDRSEEDLALTPGLGRMREVLHLRIANATEKWEANDLNDFLHLSYAAAYCDLVLGEKKTINYLRRVNPKVPAGAKLHYRAEDALIDLKRLLEVVLPD